MTDLLLAAWLLSIYPLLVLYVALTGPHNDYERREGMIGG